MGKVLLLYCHFIQNADSCISVAPLCKDSLPFSPYIYMKSFMFYVYAYASSLAFSLHIHIIKSVMP